MPELICALGPDNAGTAVTALMRQARASLDIAMYEIGPSYAWALAAASRRGVRLRVVLDGHPTDGNAATATTVVAAGGLCRVLPRGAGRGHWKLLVVDGVRVATGSGNLVWRDAPRDPRGRFPPESPPLRGTREWWAITDDAEVADRAGIAMQTAWAASRPPPRAWGRLPRVAAPGAVGVPAPQVAPLRLITPAGALRLVVGGLAAGAALCDALEQARSRALFVAPYLHSSAPGVRRLLAAALLAQSRGAGVRVLLGTRPLPRDAAHLAASGIPARWMDPAVSTRGHAKGLVADGIGVVSSANLSHTGLGANWETALVIRSEAAATYLAAAWERDWAAAVPVATV